LINNFDRYHVPDHISHHIDYITPGVKSIEVRDPEPVVNEKRNFGFRKPQPPLLKALPDSLDSIINGVLGGLLDLCSSAITPNCIQSES
jgi:tripeptidyl-peptidase-1